MRRFALKVPELVHATPLHGRPRPDLPDGPPQPGVALDDNQYRRLQPARDETVETALPRRERLTMRSRRSATTFIGSCTRPMLTYLVQRTKIGKAMRAVSFNLSVAKLMGINTDFVIAFTFAAGSALAFHCAGNVGVSRSWSPGSTSRLPAPPTTSRRGLPALWTASTMDRTPRT